MKDFKTLIFLLLTSISLQANAQTYLVKDSNADTTGKDHLASKFGIKSDGRTLNTNSIQKAIDFIHQKGGGRLVFYVGRYLTGSIHLRSNVIIHLEEGAVLVSSLSIYDYNQVSGRDPALVSAFNCKNTGITGKGVLEGNGDHLLNNIKEQAGKGFIDSRSAVPALVSIDSCDQVILSVQNYSDVAGDAIKLSNASNLTVENAAIKTMKRGDGSGVGITLSNCKNIQVTDCFLDTELPAIKLSNEIENVQFKNVVTVDGTLLLIEDNKVVHAKKQTSVF
ncbi:MAG: endopygalactorunase [Chitinophagaceae bacterium]|nr:MAG: endopygalactorunase [Chitinophagaceae bacterium]